MAKAKASYWENDSENGPKLKIVAIEHNNKKQRHFFERLGLQIQLKRNGCLTCKLMVGFLDLP